MTSIYFQKVKASADFIEDWNIPEPDFWDDKEFIKIHGTDFYLSQESLIDVGSINVSTKVKENIEINHLYKPTSFDPGEKWTDEYRSVATQTVYSPEIRFLGEARTQQRSQIVWTPFYNTNDDWVKVEEFGDTDRFLGEFDPDDVEQVDGLKVEVVLLGGGLGGSFHQASYGDPATVFIYLPEDQLIRLVDQIRSGEFEYISASFALPQYFLVKPKFSGFIRSYQEMQSYLIPSLLEADHRMRTAIKLEEYDALDAKSDSLILEEAVAKAINKEIPPLINAVVGEISSLKVAIYIIAIVMAAFAAKVFL